MTYAEESLGLARSLARLLEMGSRDLDIVGFEQALLARSAVLDLAADVHAEVAGTRRPVAGAGAVEADPVAALGRALADRMRGPTTGHAPTQVLAVASRTAAGREWAHAARHALVADHDWRAATPHRWQLTQAWTAVADAAALAEAAARLDRPLASAASRLGRTEDAELLEQASVSGLRTVAAEVSALARCGPLDGVALQRAPKQQQRVLPVHAAADLPLAQDRLVILLRQARSVRPEHVVQIALGQARAATVLSRALRRSSPPGQEGRPLSAVAAGFDGTATHLLRAGSAAGRTATLHRGDPRPVQQAGEIDRCVRRLGMMTLGGTDAEALLACGRRLPELVRTLSIVTGREVSAGRWLVPGQEDVARWSAVDPRGPAPALLAALMDASAFSRALEAVAQVPAAAPPLPSPQRPPVWAALAVALTHRDGERPGTPSARPPQAQPRHMRRPAP